MKISPLTLIKLMLKELTSLVGRRFSFLLISNMTLGLLTLSFLFSLFDSFRSNIEEKSREILSSDISVHARRLLNNDEVTQIENFLKAKGEITKSRKIQLFTLLQAESNSINPQLIELVGIDPLFPLYGKIEPSSSLEKLTNKRKIWIYPDLLKNLDLKLNEFVLVNSVPYQVQALIKSDSTLIGSEMTLALRAYVGLEDLLESGLVSNQSTLRDYYYFKFKGTELKNLDELTEIRIELEKKFPDTSLVFSDPIKKATGIIRVFGRINDFFNIFALLISLLSLIGVNFIWQNYLQGKIKTITLYKTLGLTSSNIKLFYLGQIFIITFFSAILAHTLGLISLNILYPFLKEMLKLPELKLIYSWWSFGYTLLIGLIGSLLIGLRGIESINEKGTMLLLKGDQEASSNIQNHKSNLKNYGKWTFFFLLYLLGIGTLMTSSYKMGLIFSGAIILTILFLFLMGIFIRKILLIFQNKPEIKKYFLFHYFLKRLTHYKMIFLTTFSALTFSMGLLYSVPILDSLIQQELSMEEGLVSTKKPDLFLFDIKKEVLKDLKNLLSNEKQKLEDISPMISARLIEINGKKIQRLEADGINSRDKEDAQWTRNRTYNLTYDYDGKGNLDVEDDFTNLKFSLEKRFAQRLGVNVGDKLQFEIQGIEVEGIIDNIRDVRWSSFRPNFFIKIISKHNWLKEAPQSLLGVIKLSEIGQKSHIVKIIHQKFPQVALIDVSEILNKVTQLTEVLSGIFKIIGMLSLLMGILIVIVIGKLELQRQLKEFNLLKMLGLNERKLHQLTNMHFIFIIFVSAISATLAAVIFAIILIKTFFEGNRLIVPYISILSVSMMTLLLILIYNFQKLKKLLKEHPLTQIY
jgi:putative ABC transport system permease protein